MGVWGDGASAAGAPATGPRWVSTAYFTPLEPRPPRRSGPLALRGGDGAAAHVTLRFAAGEDPGGAFRGRGAERRLTRVRGVGEARTRGLLGEPPPAGGGKGQPAGREHRADHPADEPGLTARDLGAHAGQSGSRAGCRRAPILGAQLALGFRGPSRLVASQASDRFLVRSSYKEKRPRMTRADERRLTLKCCSRLNKLLWHDRGQRHPGRQRSSRTSASH